MARKLLTNDELAIVSELRENGVLQEVDWELMNLRDGICILPCGDGDHFDDFYMWLRERMEKKTYSCALWQWRSIGNTPRFSIK